jgi:hypothetical protein
MYWLNRSSASVLPDSIKSREIKMEEKFKLTLVTYLGDGKQSLQLPSSSEAELRNN